MTLAAGPGKVIGGLAINAPYTRVYAQVQPILNAPNPGTFDSNGQYLHFRYEGNLNLGSRSGGNQDPNAIDFVPNKIVVEFDAMSSFTLPFEGHLYLVGGRGEWKFGMQVHDVVDARYYQPELRTLRTFKRAASTFVIPDFHTFILGSNPTDQFLLPTGNLLTPSNLLPGSTIVAGTQIQMVNDTTVITGWRG